MWVLFNVKIVRHDDAMLIGICYEIPPPPPQLLCLYCGSVVDVLFNLILIILSGKYPYFIEEKAESGC